MGILLQSLGLQAADDTTSPASSLRPPLRSTTPAVSADLSLTMTAVLSSVVISSGMCAGLRLQAVRAGQPVAGSWIEKPNPWTSRGDFVEAYVINAMLDGSNFLRKHRDAKGQIVATEPLNPFAVRVYTDDNGRKRFDHRLATGRVETGLTEHDITHIEAIPFPGRVRGLGPIGHARYSLTGIIDTRDYGANWFRQSDVPSGVLTTDQRLNPGDADAYREVWRKGGEYGVRVLGQGLTYDHLMLSPEDAQWLEAQKWGVSEIGRLFGMQPEHLWTAIEGKSQTYVNANNVDPRFLSTTLRPRYLRKLEDALTDMLPRGQEAKFVTDDLTQPDAKTQAEVDAIYIDKNVIDADEVRVQRGYAPREVAPR